jgi:hypothetical protein
MGNFIFSSRVYIVLRFLSLRGKRSEYHDIIMFQITVIYFQIVYDIE